MRRIVFDEQSTFDPEAKRREALAALRAKRLERAERLLKSWRTRQKRANTMVRKLKRTVEYYTRRGA